MIDTFSELEALTETSMDKAHEFMGQFTEIVLAQDHQRTEQYQTELTVLGRQTQETANLNAANASRAQGNLEILLILPLVSFERTTDLLTFSLLQLVISRPFISTCVCR